MYKFMNISAGKNTTYAPSQDAFPMHMHSDYEIFCFLDGDAEYIVEGTIYPLRKGDLVLMRNSETHRLRLLSDSDYVRMVVNFMPSNPDDPMTKKLMLPFNNRPLGKLNHYPSHMLSNRYLLHYLEDICRSDDDYMRCSYLSVLLNELNVQYESLKMSEYSYKTNLAAEVIQYINEHITESISLQELSDLFFISKSQLNRNFKQTIGSTVWKYITDKRLLMAKKEIEYGGNPTKIYLNCGFNDYTVFYRAYCLKFGFPPSKTRS